MNEKERREGEERQGDRGSKVGSLLSAHSGIVRLWPKLKLDWATQAPQELFSFLSKANSITYILDSIQLTKLLSWWQFPYYTIILLLLGIITTANKYAPESPDLKKNLNLISPFQETNTKGILNNYAFYLSFTLSISLIWFLIPSLHQNNPC